ncbi:hypothetical protein V6N13_109027 [Hibiscus sabdariffa]|uniref:Uncharacterized protein n=1 Tax=Hibiscus sabdariffa TaxID=183260 RepID=A0ABR2FNC5_9ROSI
MKPEDRIEAEQKLKKKGGGRPRNNQKSQGVANGSLSDSDFKNRKKVILREARETIALGKLIGACTVGNEEEIVKDIAHIIEARGHAL